MTDNMEQNDMNPNQLSMTGEGFENGLNGELAESADEAFWEPTDWEVYLGKLPIADKHLPSVMRENVLQGNTETDNDNGTVTVISEGNLPAEVGKLLPVPAGVRIVTETEESE